MGGRRQRPHRMHSLLPASVPGLVCQLSPPTNIFLQQTLQLESGPSERAAAGGRWPTWRTRDRWALQRGCVPHPDSGFPWARGPAWGGRTTTTSERRRSGDGSRSHSAALPTTGTRLARRGAPLHAAASARSRAAHRFIHSVHNYSCGPARRTRAAPRERAARARRPARRPHYARPPGTHAL